jgi:glycosyltransferase involved in cell wall biosynthesis
MEKVGNLGRIAFIDYEFYRIKGGIATYYKNLFYTLSDAGFSIVLFCSVSHPTEEITYKSSKIVGVVSLDIEQFRISVVSPFLTEHQLHKFILIETSEVNFYAINLIQNITGIKLHIRMHAPNYLIDFLNKTYFPFWKKVRFILGALKVGKFDLGYWKSYNKSQDKEYQYSLNADIISAPSESMMSWIDKNWSLDPPNKLVFFNPYIPSVFSSAKPLTISHQYKTILFFGRLNVLKGLRNATIAISKILSQNADWRFIVIGDDGSSPDFSNLTMKEWMETKFSKVNSQVVFYDSMPSDALKNYFEKSEILLLTSLFESFSYACLEAMSAGRVVIGSTSGGMINFIKNGSNGFLVNPSNVSEIYKCLNNLVKNHSLVCQVGDNARNYIASEFNYQNQIVYFKNVYNEMLS